jgi:hypothetical protein
MNNYNPNLIKKLVRMAFSSRLSRPILSGSAVLLCIVASAAFEAGPAAATTNLVPNGNFNISSGTGPTTLTTDANGGFGPSAAKDWGAFNDNAGTTTTKLVPVTQAPPGHKPNGNVIHVTTTNAYDGI